jgi:hypothetical protein
MKTRKYIKRHTKKYKKQNRKHTKKYGGAHTTAALVKLIHEHKSSAPIQYEKVIVDGREVPAMEVKECVMAAIDYNPLLFQSLSDELRKDKEVITKATLKFTNILEYVDEIATNR